jgi:hypothetical protein
VYILIKIKLCVAIGLSYPSNSLRIYLHVCDVFSPDMPSSR